MASSSKPVPQPISRSVFKLLSKNELNDYLLKVQKEADDLYDRLVEEYKTKWNVTEELK